MSRQPDEILANIVPVKKAAAGMLPGEPLWGIIRQNILKLL